MEQVPKEVTQAAVVAIFKKGDHTKLDNYRPISLLNTVYKVFARILKQRIEAGVDPHLQSAQFGLRKGRSTTQAVAILRRVQDYAERGGDTDAHGCPILD